MTRDAQCTERFPQRPPLLRVFGQFALATWRGVTTVIGGGDTIAAIRKAEVLDSEIVHISTGGGASLEFLGGGELPGISILNDKKG